MRSEDMRGAFVIVAWFLGAVCSLSCGRFARMVVLLLELHAALGRTSLQHRSLPRQIQNPVVLFCSRDAPLLPAVVSQGFSTESPPHTWTGGVSLSASSTSAAP